MNVRYLAARVVFDVANGHSLSDVLSPALLKLTDPRDRAFLQAICFGVCRNYSRLDYVVSLLIDQPMREKDSDVHALLLVGLYQLMEMRVPPHAAVGETVNASEKLNKKWSRGFINAILREYLRHTTELAKEIADDVEANFSHPMWIIKRVKAAWPEQWESILLENNRHPPFALRVNQQHLTREQYLEKLQEIACPALVISETSHGIVLENPMQAEELPGFAEGDISVQDGAAQLAAELLQLAPGQRVLDACSAPGGKLMHMLESEPKLAACVAVEKDSRRLVSIKENIARLKQDNVTVICKDAADVKSWWNGELFDRILLDAPCSASGVIRRHPDIMLLRQPGDIPVLVKEQAALLKALWPLLKPGGVLVYATCSIFPEENTDVMQRFLKEHADASELPIEASWGLACPVGRQILPGMSGMDGFYYARVTKKD